MKSRFDTGTLALFRRVLAYYALVALLVAAGQSWFERYRLVQEADQDIAETARHFLPILGNAVWNLDPNQARAAALGIAQNRAVARVAVADSRDAFSLAVERDRHSGFVVGPAVPGPAPADAHVLIFPIHGPEVADGAPIGTLTIHMDEGAVADQVRSAVAMIFLTTAVMALVLGAVLMFFGTAYLGRPIRALTEGVRGLSLENLGRRPLAVDTAGNAELEVLQDSFNDLARRLAEAIAREHQARQEIQEANYLAEKLALARELDAKTRRMLEEILRNSPLPTFVLDAGHRVTHWNRACEKLFGVPAAAVVGTRDAWRPFYPEPRALLADLVMDDDRERLLARLAERFGEAFKPEQFVNGSYEAEEFVPKQGRWLYFTASPMRDGEGRLVGAIETLQDISERKEAEESIRKALAQQRELNELKSRFVSMTSHEFRTPLATILSSAELLRHYLDRLPPEERTAVIVSIEDAVRRMTGMLDNMLLIGRADAGRLEFRPAPLALADFCRRLAAETATAVAPDGSALARLRLDIQVGEEPFDLDEKLLRHILGNLLANAFKYSPAGGDVSLEVALFGERLHFQVADQGIGIPPEDIPRLFETFHRGRNVGNISGTGLGMAIVRRAVDLHGGDVAVESSPGRGSRFRVSLPGRRPAPLQPAEIMDHGDHPGNR